MTGKQKDDLIQTLKRLFDPFSLQLMLSRRLDKSLLEYSGVYTPHLDNILLTLINRAIQEEWHLKLVEAVVSERPRDAALQKLAIEIQNEEDTGWYDRNPAAPQTLQTLLNNHPLLPVQLFIDGMIASKRCVCRIQVILNNGSIKWGTGFLVGSNLVLTNYHVIRDVIDQQAKPEQVTLKFDFYLSKNNIINPGTDYALDPATPVLAHSPYCSFDEEGSPSLKVDWPVDCLDYALLKLKDPAGDHPFGPNVSKVLGEGTAFEKRGWLRPSPTARAQCEGGHIIIIQHPDRKPCQVAIGFNMITGCDDKRQRVRYQVNTMGGSSGSPCFDQDFNLIALHNMGDEYWADKYNQGILIENIFTDLKNKNLIS